MGNHPRTGFLKCLESERTGLRRSAATAHLPAQPAGSRRSNYIDVSGKLPDLRNGRTGRNHRNRPMTRIVAPGPNRRGTGFAKRNGGGRNGGVFLCSRNSRGANEKNRNEQIQN